MNEQRRHIDEIGAEIDIQFVGLLQVFEVLPRNFRNGKIGDLDFMLADQRQQKVERTLETGQGNIQCAHLPLSYNSRKPGKSLAAAAASSTICASKSSAPL